MGFIPFESGPANAWPILPTIAPSALLVDKTQIACACITIRCLDVGELRDWSNGEY